MDKTSAEDVATWLARETGHVPEAEEGYEGETGGYDAEKGAGLPNPKHEKLRRFFDGLHVQKTLDEKRRSEAISQVDEAEEMNKALRDAVPPGGGI